MIGSVVVFTSVSFGLSIPEAAALLIPATAARLQLKVVPVTPLVGVYENMVLLQIAGGVCELERVGIGLTVTKVEAVAVHRLASVTNNDYNPEAAGVTLVISGFCRFEVKPSGPAQL